MPSRRSVLASGTALIGTALAGCLSSVDVDVEPWTPAAGTWPLSRYDVRNSAVNPHATPPRDPETAWRVSTAMSSSDDDSLSGVRVAEDVVVGFGTAGVNAFDAADGDEHWSHDGHVTAAAIYGSTLYVVGPDDGDSSWTTAILRAFDLRDGDLELEMQIDDEDRPRVTFLTVTDEFVFAGDHHADEMLALDRDSGELLWSIEPGWTLAIHERGLFLGGNGDLSMHAPPEGLGSRFEDGPELRWTVDAWYDSPVTPLAVDDRYLYSGSFRPWRDHQTSVHAYDLTGQKRWTSEPRGMSTATPAITDDYCYTVQTESGTEDAHLVALDRDDGGQQWRHEVDTGLWVAVVAGDVVIASGFGDEREDDDDDPTGAPTYEGSVLALETDGTELWDAEFDSSVTHVAAVEDRVYLALRDGDIVALEDL